MSRQASDWAWKTPAKGGDLLVLLALADWADPKTHDCYPHVDTIAAKVGLSRRAVQKSVSWLEGVGIVKVHRATGRGHASAYLLNVAVDVFDCCPEDAKACTTCTDYDPSTGPQTVQEVHPSEAVKGADGALFTEERVHRLQKKGAPGAPPIGNSQRTNNPPTPPGGTKRRRQKTTDVRNTPEFQKFWDAFGHKKAIAAAERMWLRALARPGITAEFLTERAVAYRERLIAEGKWPQYAAHPSTWLNEERYLDEIVTGPGVGTVHDLFSNRPPEDYLRDLWRNEDAVTVAGLAGVPWIEPDQDPDDPTPRERFLQNARRQFITDNREAAIAALQARRSA